MKASLPSSKELEWLHGHDLAIPKLARLIPSDRKRRLSLIAFLNEHPAELQDSMGFNTALELIVRYFDGKATEAHLRRAEGLIGDSARMYFHDRTDRTSRDLYNCLEGVIATQQDAKVIRLPQLLDRKRQARILRDIFGNPFRPVTFDPTWQTSASVSLAQSMYDSRDFAAMPVLADALEEAGCRQEEVLGHCRDEKQIHVRGCWVVDLVLGNV